jgi:hypothetical protein
MATASLVPSAIDFAAPHTYTIRLGAGVLKPKGSNKWTSVRYNHKPAGKDISSTILPSTPVDNSSSKASLRLGDKEWKYDGTCAQSEDTYVLLIGEKEQEAVLERVQDIYTYNLVSAPEESDAAKLARKYEHIAADEPTGSEENEPDADNPFDWRHFLRKEEAKRDATLTSTPLQQARAKPAAATPKAAAVTAKRKTPASANTKATAPKSKRPRPSTSAPTTAKAAVPTVRLDRKASIRHPSSPPKHPSASSHPDNSDDNDGELILANPSSSSLSSKGAGAGSSMHLALSGAFGKGTGPTSLRSAASLPGSRIASPALAPTHESEAEAEDAEEEGEGEQVAISHEFEFDNSDSDADADGDADDDNDVEELELEPPAQRVVQEQEQEELGEEDDMEAQLALAFEAEAAAPATTNAEDSDEDVSEEE